ncbi:ribonuclease H-like domain-containing protein [Tanacetum coccineum]
MVIITVFNKYNYIDHGKGPPDPMELAQGQNGEKKLENIAHLLDFKDFDGGYVTFGGGAYGGRITGKAERKNRTLIEATRTMLADSKLPTTFWAEAVSTTCYVQNRVLIVKPHNKTPYELFRGFKPAIGFMKPFGCHVTILNTLDKLGMFDGKSDEGTFSNDFSSKQGVSESSTSSQQDQDCIVMPIWKDASYFGDDAPRSVADAQIQDKDSRDVSTVVLEVNTATPEDLVGPSHASEVTQVDERKGTRGLSNGSQQCFPLRSDEEEVYVCQPPGFEDLDHPDKVYKSNRKKKGIFISQDKYVYEILRKYNYTNVNSASTPTDLEKPLVQDRDAADVDEHSIDL